MLKIGVPFKDATHLSKVNAILEQKYRIEISIWLRGIVGDTLLILDKINPNLLH